MVRARRSKSPVNLMLRIATHRAVPGMTLALPVLHPQRPEHTLLKPGAALDHASLAALTELNVSHLWIRCPATEFLLRYADTRLIQAQARLASRLGEAFDAVASDMHADFEFNVYLHAIRSLVERIMDNHDAALFFADLVTTPTHLMTQSANVCYLSLLMGLKLDSYLVTERNRIDPRRAQNVENLGIGALFADIGMLRISPEARRRWVRSLDESDPEFQRHCALGFDTVRGKIPATASAAVLHHHQRMDGSGFPRRARIQGPPRPLAGSEIHVFARIIAVAELFERFRNPPRDPEEPSNPRLLVPPVRALRHVLDLARTRRLDPVVFKALAACAPAYPPGSFVTLSSGQTCVVIGFDPTRPCQPSVSPVTGFDMNEGQLSLGEPIDLRTRQDLVIVLTEGQDVRADNFSPLYPGEFDLRMPFVPSAKGQRTAAEMQRGSSLSHFGGIMPIQATAVEITRRAS